MASHGAGAAAGSDAPHPEVVSTGQTNPSPYPPLSSSHHSWSSATGSATVSWNKTVDKLSQDTVYYDPQRDVSVSGGNQNVGSSAPHVAQLSMGMADAAHSHVPYSSSAQPVYNPVEYANYYYTYPQPQATNDSSVQQGANQHPGAAYQPLTSFQNSGSYIDPTSNTYYNAGGHQTVPGYGSSSYYYQNNTWNDGSTGNNFAQSYQNYSSSDTNAQQSSTSVPANSLPYQQQYNQWPYYYNQSVPSASNPVPLNSTTDNLAANTPSGYSYPSSQPPPPGTTSWKSNSVASVAPPVQFPGVPGHQNQYSNQAEGHYNQGSGVQWSQNHYAYQTQPYPQMTNSNHPALSNLEDQQRTVDSNGPSTNLSSNHVSENFKPNLQGSVTMDTSSESKVQVPINPRIAPGFSMVIPKNEKKNSGLDLSKKPAYVSVSMPMNDAKATQVGPDARSIPFSLRNYATRNLNRCKNDAQRAACRSIMEEITKKAIAEGTLLTKNWDTEPLFPLPESVVGMTGTSVNNLSPFSSVSTPRKRVKSSRWEPVVDENVTNKVEQLTKGLISSNVHSTLDPKNRTPNPVQGNSWNHGKFLQSHQAPSNKVNQRPAKKQKMASNLTQIQNGSASSDSEKEHDLTKYYASATALANSPEEKKRREHRSKRFEKNKDSSLSRNTSANNDAMARARREISSRRVRTYEEGTLAVEDMDWDALTVKGTCQEIEKDYLRLTEAPDPAKIRPEDVLEKALTMVETSQKKYFYKCGQLKSIRQDLTVQRIQNELTVKVYETHARLAMQAGDLPEFNQCQSQLKRLYAQGIKGCYFEFSAYNLLCVMLHSNNKRDLLSSMASLSKEAKQDAAVKHALAVHASVLSGNYVLFFKLYKKAPNLNSCLMDLYVERMRFEAMKCMSKSYRPTVPVGYVAQILGFLRTDTEGCATNGDDGLEECEKWLKAHGTVLSEDNSGELHIDMKASSSTLYMPEPEDAVAHGDASLAVDNFLARTDGHVKRCSSDGPAVDTP